MTKLKIYLPFAIVSLLLFFTSCREDVFIEPEETGYANLFVDSQPRGASIFLDGEFTEQNTPSWLNRVNSGKVKIKLILEGYSDTTVSIQLKESTNELLTIFLNSE